MIERWDGARDLYVIVAGSARVSRGDETLAELGPGAFFGELAALDWGASFGYARLAWVTATAPLRLLVLSPALLSQLMGQSPEVNRTIRSAVRERLPSL